MPIQIQWDDSQQTYIRKVFTAPFDLNDWYEAVTETCIMLNSVQHSVNIILDMSIFDHLPMQFIDALNTSKSRYHINHFAQIAVVQQSLAIPMQRLLDDTDMLQGTHVVSTLETAYQILDEMRFLASAS